MKTLYKTVRLQDGEMLSCRVDLAKEFSLRYRQGERIEPALKGSLLYCYETLEAARLQVGINEEIWECEVEATFSCSCRDLRKEMLLYHLNRTHTHAIVKTDKASIEEFWARFTDVNFCPDDIIIYNSILANAVTLIKRVCEFGWNKGETS